MVNYEYIVHTCIHSIIDCNYGNDMGCKESQMKFELSIEDYTIILNALHYYKKVEKYPNFAHFNEERVNELRDKMAHQIVWKQNVHDT